MSPSAITFENVSFSYDDKAMLSRLAFNVFDGEFVSIIGKSGSGKTTLFRLISGLEEPSAGSILINDRELSSRLGTVGYMPQQDLLMPWRTVFENAMLPLELHHTDKNLAREQVKRLLVEFGLEGYENYYAKDLSGGMRQRVSFLRASLSGSNILLLDEPFSALDAITRQVMQEWLLAKWDKSRQSVLFITHDVDEALFLSDRIFILTEAPTSKLTEVKVTLDRPRKLTDFNHPEIVALKQQLINTLRATEL